MGTNPSRRRARAARLTDEAVLLLEERLRAEWAAGGGHGEMTRAARAALLEVSLGTADRILKQKGNDRSVLRGAFEALRLPWKDEYCASLSAPEPLPPPAPATPEASTLDEEPSSVPEPDVQVETTKPPRQARWAWAVGALALTGAGAVIAVSLLAGSWSAPALATGRQSRPLAELEAKLAADGRDAYNRGDYGSALQFAASSRREARVSRSADGLASALHLEGDVLAAQGDLEGAAERYRQSLPFWDALEHSHGRGVLLEVLAVVEARLGRLDEAERHFRESIALRRFNPPVEPAGPLRGLGSVAAVRGDFAQARFWYAAAKRRIGDDPGGAMRLDLKALEALTKRDEGRYSEALRDLQECLAGWEAHGHDRWVAATLVQVASVLIASGDSAAAGPALQRALALYQRVGDRKGAELAAQMLRRPAGARPSRTQRIEEYF